MNSTEKLPNVHFDKITVVHLGSYAQPHSKHYSQLQVLQPDLRSFFFVFWLVFKIWKSSESIFYTLSLREPREGRLCCHHWHIKPQSTPHENIPRDKSAGLVRCVCNTQACHGTFVKWLLMDMKDNRPCWKKPQSGNGIGKTKISVCCYRKFGILFFGPWNLIEYLVLVAHFM